MKFSTRERFNLDNLMADGLGSVDFPSFDSLILFRKDILNENYYI